MDTLIPHTWSALQSIVNTPNCVTDGFEFSVSREFTDYKDAETKAIAHRLASNPVLSMAFTGKIFALAGLAIAVVGSAVTEVPNFTTMANGQTWRGHDPDEGTMILEDAKDSLPGGPEMIGTSWTIGHYPFLE